MADMRTSEQARKDASTPHDWKAERRAVVLYLRQKAKRDAECGCEHEATLMRGLARQIEQGAHRGL